MTAFRNAPEGVAGLPDNLDCAHPRDEKSHVLTPAWLAAAYKPS